MCDTEYYLHLTQNANYLASDLKRKYKHIFKIYGTILNMFLFYVFIGFYFGFSSDVGLWGLVKDKSGWSW